jgi:hypothetical protein
MILLITPAAAGKNCAATLQSAIGEPAEYAENFRDGSNLLRTGNYSAVVVDECLADADPDGAEVLLQHTGTAVLLYVNLAITGAERMARELKHALERHRHECEAAHEQAEGALRNELKGPVTAVLLSCELALAVPGLPVAAEAKLRSVYELTSGLCSRLGITPESRNSAHSARLGGVK